jgi:hypothetical protein
MTKKLKNKLKNKTIYITPYNDIAIKLYKSIKRNNINCTFLGFIDKNKQGDNIYSDNSIIADADITLITSPAYRFEIYDTLYQYITESNTVITVNQNFKKFDYKSISNKRKQIVCFGNCQAYHIGRLLGIYLNDTFEVINFFNYKDINKITILNAIKKADLVIYQPLSDKHNELSFKNIKNIAKKNNINTITFPYIYNNGIYSLEYGNISTIHGKEIIINLLKEGNSVDSIIHQYHNGNIDFNLHERFRNSLNIMKNREKYTDIKLIDFIQKNFQNKKLFYSYSHPTNRIFFEILKQIKNKSTLDFKIKKSKKLPRLCKTLSPISPYDKMIHKYKFNCDYSREWAYKGDAIISLIAQEYKLENQLKVIDGK